MGGLQPRRQGRLPDPAVADQVRHVHVVDRQRRQRRHALERRPDGPPHGPPAGVRERNPRTPPARDRKLRQHAVDHHPVATAKRPARMVAGTDARQDRRIPREALRRHGPEEIFRQAAGARPASARAGAGEPLEGVDAAPQAPGGVAGFPVVVRRSRGSAPASTRRAQGCRRAANGRPSAKAVSGGQDRDPPRRAPARDPAREFPRRRNRTGRRTRALRRVAERPRTGRPAASDGRSGTPPARPRRTPGYGPRPGGCQLASTGPPPPSAARPATARSGSERPVRAPRRSRFRTLSTSRTTDSATPTDRGVTSPML